MHPEPYEKVVLPGIDVELPVIGFGCSALTGTSRRTALQILDSAFDCGVRHFDVARYYGYGEAERILGTFAKSRRTQITIATKFGIEPPKRTTAFQIALQAGRWVVRLLPAARKIIQRKSKNLIRSGAFSVRQAQSSLETSLRELGSDYIDLYLLHDYSLDAPSREELVIFLTDAVKAGKILRFGIGTSIENVLQTFEFQPELCGIVQFQNSVLTRNVDRLPFRPSDRLVITHGSLGESYQSVLLFLKTQPDIARNWSAKLCLDCSSEDTLSALMLNYAAEANSNGLVLFSSRKPARVRKNIKDVLERDLSIRQITLFGELVRQELASIRKE